MLKGSVLKLTRTPGTKRFAHLTNVWAGHPVRLAATVYEAPLHCKHAPEEHTQSGHPKLSHLGPVGRTWFSRLWSMQSMCPNSPCGMLTHDKLIDLRPFFRLGLSVHVLVQSNVLANTQMTDSWSSSGRLKRLRNGDWVACYPCLRPQCFVHLAYVGGCMRSPSTTRKCESNMGSDGGFVRSCWTIDFSPLSSVCILVSAHKSRLESNEPWFGPVNVWPQWSSTQATLSGSPHSRRFACGRFGSIALVTRRSQGLGPVHYCSGACILRSWLQVW